jgi:hypothetical protein
VSTFYVHVFFCCCLLLYLDFIYERKRDIYLSEFDLFCLTWSPVPSILLCIYTIISLSMHQLMGF